MQEILAIFAEDSTSPGSIFVTQYSIQGKADTSQDRFQLLSAKV
jgi:hypothetical protein